MPKIKQETLTKLNDFLEKLVNIGHTFTDYELTPLMVSGKNEIDPNRILIKLTGYIKKRDYAFLKTHLKPIGFTEVKQRDIQPYFVRHEMTPQKETIKVRMLPLSITKKNLVVEISGSISLSSSDISDFRTFLNPFSSLSEEQAIGVFSRWVTLGKITE